MVQLSSEKVQPITPEFVNDEEFSQEFSNESSHNQSQLTPHIPSGSPGIGPEYIIKAAETVRSIRYELGWTTKDVAKATGFSRPHISCIETGKVRPSLPYYFFLLERLEKLREMELMLKESGGDQLEFKAKPRLKRRVRKDPVERRVDMKEIDMADNRAKLMMMKDRAERAKQNGPNESSVPPDNLEGYDNI